MPHFKIKSKVSFATNPYKTLPNNKKTYSQKTTSQKRLLIS
jgi:hypothetical protein